MEIERAIDRDIGGRSLSRSADALIGALAERQHGVVGRAQLLGLGLGRDAIDHRVASGRLHVRHHGVYAVGHRVLSMRGRWMAAVLAAPAVTVLSHRAAAGLWRIRQSNALEVTAPRHCKRPGILAHRAVLPVDEITEVDGIPVTTVARTIFDLAAVLPKHDVESAISQADYRRHTDLLSLGDLVARYPRRRGTRTLRKLLAEGAAMSRSELERAFLAFVDAQRLEKPHTNAHIHAGGRWHECDAVWPKAKLIVELDGYDAHRTRKAFDDDRADDRLLRLAGWFVTRVTSRHLRDPARLAAELRGLGAG